MHILTPGFVGASQGFWDLGGRVIYFQGSMENYILGGGGAGVREQGFDEHILRSWGERQFSFREQ